MRPLPRPKPIEGMDNARQTVGMLKQPARPSGMVKTAQTTGTSPQASALMKMRLKSIK